MISKTSSLAFCLSALCAAACAQSPSAQLVGKWTFKALNAPSSMPPASKDAVSKRLSGSTLRYEKNGAFTMLSGANSIKGTWSLAGRNISIKPTAFNGKTPAQAQAQAKAQIDMAMANPQLAKNPQVAAQIKMATTQIQHMGDTIKAVLSSDGKTVTLMPSTGNQGTVTFQKASG